MFKSLGCLLDRFDTQRARLQGGRSAGRVNRQLAPQVAFQRNQAVFVLDLHRLRDDLLELTAHVVRFVQLVADEAVAEHLVADDREVR